ncbi:MAG: hypothetical protein RQ982_11075 [Gammaproteobacteria bacterium]|nr:hypothetical protein [Gammaproteobacteria bacterium]
MLKQVKADNDIMKILAWKDQPLFRPAIQSIASLLRQVLAAE